MQEYKCTVKKEDGSTLRGYIVKAEDENSLTAQIRAAGMYLVGYEQVEERRDIMGGNKIRLSSKDIALLCRQLSSMLTSGVTLVKALNILYLQMERKNIKETIRKLYESVQRGEQFSEAMQKQSGVYPDLMISMIEAGEGSGRLDQVTTRLAEHYEKEVRLKAKIRSALTYPIILVLLTVTVVIVLVTQVLPIFVGMFESTSMELPAPTKIVIGFSDLLTQRWYILLAVLGVLAFGFRAWIGTDAGKKTWHGFLLQIPVVGSTVMKVSAVRFSRTLSTLLSSGMNLLQSLEISTRVVGNRFVADGLITSREDIRKGMSLSQSLRRVNVMPPMVYSMIGIGEESGTMENMLQKCAEYYDDEVDNAITKLVDMIQPLLIVVMAVVIGFIVISMLLPIFQIYNSMA